MHYQLSSVVEWGTSTGEWVPPGPGPVLKGCLVVGWSDHVMTWCGICGFNFSRSHICMGF